MSFNNGPRTVTTGLSLLVDAADPLSYPGSGTSWTDIVTGITGSLSGSITYASDFKGALVVNDSSSVIIFPTSSGNFGTDSFTVELAFQPNQINGQHWLVAKNSGSFPSWGAFITGSGGSGRITAFFNVSSTISCSMSTPVDSIVTGSNYLVDINFLPGVSTNTIYLNSELSGSNTPNGSGSLSATSSLFISNRNSGSSVGTSLEIFNTKLYTPKLVAGRIRQNYNSLSTRLGLPQKSYITILPDGLLNFYPGAAAAYSLRALNSNYEGSAIRVRRSSDNTEQDIGFIGNDLDTTSLLSFVGAGDGFVTTWYDQSGNGYDAIQTTAANQPQIVSSGSVLTLNQNAAINFNGSHFYRSGNGVLNNPIIDAFTLFSEEQLTSAQVVFALPQATTHTNPFARFWLFLSTVETQVRQNGVVYSGSPLTASTQYLFNVNSKNAIVYRNESIYISGKSTNDLTYPNSVPFMIGANASNDERFIGKLQELIIYTTDQSSNRTGISNNINNFYSIY